MTLAALNCHQELQHALANAKDQVRAATTAGDKRALRAMKKRLQDRLYQRKHRAKRDQKLHSLEVEIHGLHSKIARLHRDLNRSKVAAADAEAQHRQQLQHPTCSLQEHARSLVLQYFRVYQNGYSLPLATAQERFLRSILATHVEGVDLSGADAFVQQWRLYGQYFALCALDPQSWRFQKLSDSVLVVVEVMLYVRFHRQTIGALFPNLKSGKAGRDFVQPLVAGTTPVVGIYTFTVERTGFVSCLLVSLQLLEALQRVLGSLESVMQLTEGTRLALGSGTITLP
ncbi:hypothetical protein BBJ28_00002990 [Nothophytophthora sp. Chile5]|nr:hypothetical protein BBJ28_00002990 [Nothophytophthora sp. Chile5]